MWIEPLFHAASSSMHIQLALCLPGGESTQRTYSHRVGGALPAYILKGHRQRAVLVQHVIGHHHGQSSRHAKVGHEADEERGDDADGDGPLRILHLLT